MVSEMVTAVAVFTATQLAKETGGSTERAFLTVFNTVAEHYLDDPKRGPRYRAELRTEFEGTHDRVTSS
ncbi:hypothetical protein ACWD4N_06300 [Streptomyces sp. NPDC002586]